MAQLALSILGRRPIKQYLCIHMQDFGGVVNPTVDIMGDHQNGNPLLIQMPNQPIHFRCHHRVQAGHRLEMCIRDRY